MKVTQILYSGLGGHGSVAFSLVQASRVQATWANSLLFVGVEPLLPEYRRLCDAQRVEYSQVRVKPGRAWASWLRVYQELAQLRPDAIILHSVKSILPCALYARRRGIPLLAVEHQPNALKHRGEWIVSRLLMRLANNVVVLTEEYRSELRERLAGHWTEAKVRLIPNGIDTIAFRPAERIKKSPTRRIGMAARMTPAKRQDLLIDAIARLAETDRRVDWRLSLAGEGETLEGLRELVRERHLDDVVEFPGYLAETALREWFGSLDMYVHASEGETLSTSLLQALAMGLPVVGSDVPGINNLLSSGGGVGLTAGQTPEGFAVALQHLSSHPALAHDLGARARKLAVGSYSHDAMFTQYNALLRLQ